MAEQYSKRHYRKYITGPLSGRCVRILFGVTLKNVLKCSALMLKYFKSGFDLEHKLICLAALFPHACIFAINNQKKNDYSRLMCFI